MKIYIETTIFNRYFEEHREYANDTKMLFKKIASKEIEAFTSVAVLEELEKAPEPKRGKMLSTITEYNIATLELSSEAYDLADLYVEMGIIPARFYYDGIHIAMAVIHGIDCVISLNFHHINKLKTKASTEIVNRMKGYGNPFICTPAEVIYNDM